MQPNGDIRAALLPDGDCGHAGHHRRHSVILVPVTTLTAERRTEHPTRSGALHQGRRELWKVVAEHGRGNDAQSRPLGSLSAD